MTPTWQLFMAWKRGLSTNKSVAIKIISGGSHVSTDSGRVPRLEIPIWKAPLVLTEHGALQAANVIKSAQANKMSAHIFRTSVLVRKMALINEVFARKVNQLENRVSDHHTLLIELVRKIQR